jgi:hypothetical protein
MFRTQIQLTEEQARALKRLAARENKSVAEMIRQSVDLMLHSGDLVDPEKQRRKAIAAAGIFQGGPKDLSTDHDRYFAETLK